MASVLYFASLRERLGVSQEAIALPAGGATVATLVALLRARGGAWEDAFRPDSVWRVAVNQQMAAADTPVGAEDEIAFFPPVTGG
jgi:molybdopterin synthase sulfur carrier subunit